MEMVGTDLQRGRSDHLQNPPGTTQLLWCVVDRIPIRSKFFWSVGLLLLLLVTSTLAHGIAVEATKAHTEQINEKGECREDGTSPISPRWVLVFSK